MHAGGLRAAGSLLGASLFFLGLIRLAAASSHGWVEDFAEGRLDPSRWERIVDGDVRDWSADVVEARGSRPGFRLRLRADTRGTHDDTVKHVGVRTREPIVLRDGARVSVRLDWGDQANGSYLAAAVVLSPHATSRNPLETPDWVKVAYIGVPPGRHARMVVERRRHGRERTVYTEGWPDVNPAGRRITVQDVTLGVRDRSLDVLEAGRLVWRSGPGDVSFDPAYVYLVLSSHSNYPARSVYFERVDVR